MHLKLSGKEIKRGPMVHHASNGQFALRSGPWKLIVNDGKGKKAKQKTSYELYNLAKDPSETTDLANKQTERVQSLAAVLEQLKGN